MGEPTPEVANRTYKIEIEKHSPILVGYCFHRTIRGQFTSHLVALIAQLNNLGFKIYTTCRGGTYIGQLRNLLLEEAVKSGCKKLLMIDDDIYFRIPSILRLLSFDVPFIGVPYLCRAAIWEQQDGQKMGPMKPAFQINHEFPSPSQIVSFINDARENDTLVEVDYVGTGVFLMDVAAAVKVKDKGWFNHIEDLGDDVAFCKRARQAGFKILVDFSTEVSHVCEYPLSMIDYVRSCASELKQPLNIVEFLDRDPTAPVEQTKTETGSEKTDV
jgi:hypothetical protein